MKFQFIAVLAFEIRFFFYFFDFFKIIEFGFEIADMLGFDIADMIADMLGFEIADMLGFEIADQLRATEGQNHVLIQRASADRN